MKRETSTVADRTVVTNSEESEERSQTEEHYLEIHPLFWLVADSTCTWCEEGRVGISSDKGDPTMGCSRYETPRGRMW